MRQKIIIILFIIIIGSIFYIIFNQRIEGSAPFLESASIIYKIDDKEKPIITIEPENMIKDAGNMKVSEERVAEFTLRNMGLRPLSLSRLRTSCMCTFGEIIIGNIKSPEVNMEMHNTAAARDWQASISPGETAIARITYRPRLMPVEGLVERYFSFETNDPLRPNIELALKAFVEF